MTNPTLVPLNNQKYFEEILARKVNIEPGYFLASPPSGNPGRLDIRPVSDYGFGPFNIDGGAADSVYTPSLFMDGGGA